MALAKWKMASMILRNIFIDEDFNYEEADENLKISKGGFPLTKASWNAMIRNNAIEAGEEEGYYHFVYNSDEDDENSPVNSNWTATHRQFFSNEDGSKTGFGDLFTEEDLPEINKMYFMWKEMGEVLNNFGCRRMNVPELISEGLCSVLFKWYRTNSLPLTNIPNSADLVESSTGDAIQVKSISTLTDEDGGPTSFGPKTEFDRLIAMHIRLDKDTAYFYEFDNPKEYKKWKVNGQLSIEEQQAQDRRPRLTLLPLIKQKEMMPFATYTFKK